MSLSPELLSFIKSAVRLPPERLKQIDRTWEQLYSHRVLLSELVQASEQLREAVRALREYTLAEARRAALERPEERLIPEDLFEAVFPAARAVLLRHLLEDSNDEQRGRAFAALTAPFADILP